MFIAKSPLPSSPFPPSCSRFWASTCFSRIGTEFGIMEFGIIEAVTLSAFLQLLIDFRRSYSFG
ncbi:hypothetical protein K435DRAFT_784986, partial [Dendrothele bispora CBS 962.96]